MLSHTHLAPDFSIDVLARRTDGLSGSDLRETCRNAAMAPVRELMREKGRSGKEGLEAAKKEVSGGRGWAVSCFLVAFCIESQCLLAWESGVRVAGQGVGGGARGGRAGAGTGVHQPTYPIAPCPLELS